MNNAFLWVLAVFALSFSAVAENKFTCRGCEMASDLTYEFVRYYGGKQHSVAKGFASEGVCLEAMDHDRQCQNQPQPSDCGFNAQPNE